MTVNVAPNTALGQPVHIILACHQTYVINLWDTRAYSLLRGIDFSDDRYFSDVAAHTLRPKTLEAYESLIRLHIKPELGQIKLSVHRPDHLQVSSGPPEGDDIQSLVGHLQLAVGERRTPQMCW